MNEKEINEKMQDPIEQARLMRMSMDAMAKGIDVPINLDSQDDLVSAFSLLLQKSPRVGEYIFNETKMEWEKN